MEIEIRSLDTVVKDHFAKGGENADLPANLKFIKHGEIGFHFNPDTLIGGDELNDEALGRIRRGEVSASGIPTGICEFSNVHVLGRSGLIIDLENRTIWKGCLMNWSSAFAPTVRRFADLERGTTSLDIDAADLQVETRAPEAVLLSGSGFHIYGHWLVDYLPRLNRAVEHGHGGMPMFFHTVPGWASRLAALVAPAFEAQSPFENNKVAFFERLVVPTAIRAHGLLEENEARHLWQTLDGQLAKQDTGPADAGIGDKIYVSRRKWKKPNGTRFLKNAAAVEALFERAGFSVISPETLPLPMQRHIFSKARVVAGEDGSGMHNTIFSKPGTRIGVISMGRVNSLHLNTANLLGQHITYIPSQPVDPEEESPEVFRVTQKAVKDALEVLLG